MAESVKNEINKSLTFALVVVVVFVAFKAESEKTPNHYDLSELKCTYKLVLMIAHKHKNTHIRTYLHVHRAPVFDYKHARVCVYVRLQIEKNFKHKKKKKLKHC